MRLAPKQRSVRPEITPTAETCMTDAATDATAEIETDQPLPIPGCAQAMLKAMLAHRGIAYCEEDGRVMTGTPEERGQVLPCTATDGLIMMARGLINGERGRLLVTRVGRRFAADGVLVRDEEIQISDVDLAAFGRGTMDYLQHELLEGVEASLYQVALDRREALDAIIKAGLIAFSEARRDV
jgi:hypothetical protein